MSWLSPEERSNYKNILTEVDFDLDIPDTVDRDINWKILGLSSSQALFDHSAMYLVHVWDAPGERLIRVWSNDPQQASIAYSMVCVPA